MHTAYLYEAHSNVSHSTRSCISIKLGKTETNHEVQLHTKTHSHPSNNMNELAVRAFYLITDVYSTSKDDADKFV